MLLLCCILLYSTNRKLPKTIYWVKYTLATSCTKLGTRSARYIVEKKTDKTKIYQAPRPARPKGIIIEDFRIRLYDAVETGIHVGMFRRRLLHKSSTVTLLKPPWIWWQQALYKQQLCTILHGVNTKEKPKETTKFRKYYCGIKNEN